MINRRLIRIKVFQALFGEFGQENSKPSTALNTIKKSILGVENNFLGVLNFGPSLSHFIESEHNPTEFKYQPSSEDIKAFKLIAENSFFNKVAENEVISAYSKKPTVDWMQEKDILFVIYKEIKSSNAYKIAMNKELNEEADFELAKFIYKHLLLDSVEFEQLMEDKNIFWYDEKIPILKGLERVFQSYEENREITIPSGRTNDDENIQMADDLVSTYYAHISEIQDIVGTYTPGWESERITKTDYILLIMALCEFKYMPMIPVKVTLNEYIEIAKMYSTPKSSKFINGTLDKILNDWKEAGLINKKGRGLIG